MIPNPSPKIEKAREQKVLSSIAETGWSIMSCPSEKDSPFFAYTIGLVGMLRHPEIILFGLDLKESASALHLIVGGLKNGSSTELLKPYGDILTNPCMFASVDINKHQWLGYASWYHKVDFSAIQCFWAGPLGRWPWNKDCDSRVKWLQPILNTDLSNHHFLEASYYPQGSQATTVVRRYLTKSKFDRLLADESIYFSNIKSFLDNFEGSTPTRLFESNKKILAEFAAFSDRYAGEAVLVEKLRTDRRKANLNASYVNCWYGDSHDSVGMWDYYVKNANGEGVAIVSNYGALMRSFIDEIPAGHDFVEYIDFDSDEVMSGKMRFKFSEQPLNFKRIEYKSERELRLIAFRPEEVETQERTKAFEPAHQGINLKVNLETLIHQVVVCPGASDAFFEKIQAAIKSKGLAVPVVRSPLGQKPVY